MDNLRILSTDELDVFVRLLETGIDPVKKFGGLVGFKAEYRRVLPGARLEAERRLYHANSED
jgi:hypothetical protein